MQIAIQTPNDNEIIGNQFMKEMITCGLIIPIQCLMTSKKDGPTIGRSLMRKWNWRVSTSLVTPEMARRPTSNVPSNRSPASLLVVVKRISLLLNKAKDFTLLVLYYFGRMVIHSCRQLYKTLKDTQNTRTLAAAFTSQFEKASGGLILCHEQSSYFRCASMYMDFRWEYDHEYFQHMIEHK